MLREVDGLAQAVTTVNFDSEVLQSTQPVLVDFWAAWCAPCRMLGPTVERLAEQYAGRVKVVKVDVDENQDLAARYQVFSIPTVVLFHNGREEQRWVGVRPQQAYAKELDRLLGQ